MFINVVICFILTFIILISMFLQLTFDKSIGEMHTCKCDINNKM